MKLRTSIRAVLKDDKREVHEGNHVKGQVVERVENRVEVHCEESGEENVGNMRRDMRMSDMEEKDE